jgi:hypothetical protein
MTRPTRQELITALKRAISVYDYASMTLYEREVTKDDRDYAETILARVRSEHPTVVQ